MTDTRDTSRVLTLVFTDLADSTALKTQRGDVAVGDLISRHRDHVTRIAAESSGRVIDWAGDGCFLTFETSSAAVLFALRVQQAHAEEPDLPGVRIGVHMGEVTEKPGPDNTVRIEGLAVDIAARISGLTKPGQVLMSSAVYNSARQRMGVEAMGMPLLWQLHGTYALKGFDTPLDIGEAGLKGIAPLEAPKVGDKARLVRKAKRQPELYKESSGQGVPVWAFALVVVALLGVIGFLLMLGQDDVPTASAPSEIRITSLVVLPLDNLMKDPEQDYFVDGMTEAITAELSKISSLKVISRTSAQQYRDTDLSAREIAEALDVEGLIEGSVLREGDEVRVTVQLIHGPSDGHLWAESYTETITSVLKLQSNIALAIASEIGASLSGEERESISDTREVNADVNEAVLRGRFVERERTAEAFAAAIRFYDEAVQLDPTYAPAYAGLADVYMLSGTWGYTPSGDSLKRAEAYAYRAAELDSTLAEPYAALSWVAGFRDRDWAASERYFQDAIDRNANYARAYHWHGMANVYAGRSDVSIELLERASELDPLSLMIQSNVAAAYCYAQRVDEGLKILESMRRNTPEFPGTYIHLPRAYELQGRYAEALESGRQYVEVTNNNTTSRARLARIYAIVGDFDSARTLVDELLADPLAAENEGTPIAVASYLLGDTDRAFEIFQRAADLKNPQLTFMKYLFTVPALLDDDRYWAFLDTLNFQPYPANHPNYEKEQAWFTRRDAAQRSGEPIERIAVLPFANISGDPEQEWFVDGMTEALTMELARIKALTIVSRTSAMQYKNVLRPISEIARELKVDALIEGSAIRQGNRVRVTAQLIDGRTDQHLWAQRYDGTMEDIFKLQSEIALAIAGEVHAAVSPEEQARIESVEEIDPAAYDAYLRGMYFWNRRDLEEAIPHFEHAIELAPNYARAHSGLANAYSLMGTFGILRPSEAHAKTMAHAERALELDANLPDAYAAIGWSLISVGGKWEESDAAFKKAQELDPEYAPSRYWYGLGLTLRGRSDEGLRELEKALTVDPVSIAAGRLNVYVHYLARKPEEVIRLGLAHLELAPRDDMVIVNVSNAYVRMSQLDLARAVLDEFPAWRTRSTGGNTIPYFKLLGMEAVGREMLAEDLNREFISYLRVARYYLALGEPEKALDALERAEIDGQQTFLLNVDPFYDPIREDPRFQDILRRMNFPELGAAND